MSLSLTKFKAINITCQTAAFNLRYVENFKLSKVTQAFFQHGLKLT